MAPCTRTTFYDTPKAKDLNLQRGLKRRAVEKTQKETVGVYLRLRPSASIKGSIVKESNQQVKTVPLDENAQPKYYSYTRVFDNATQDDIFKEVARPVINDVIISAKDGLIFTYGVTGSGKTYTMQGSDSDPGLVQRSIHYLFESIRERLKSEGSVVRQQEDNTYMIKNPLYPDLGCPALSCKTPSWQKWLSRQEFVSDPNAHYCLFISLIELYNKYVYDLFEEDECDRKKKLHCDSSYLKKAFVVNAREIEVRSADQAVDEYMRGVGRRRVGSTALNQESSRGHCVLFLKLVQIRRSHDGKPNLTSSQLCLVDLAGSERTKESGVTGGASKETGNINNSLSVLRRCIVALRDREPTNINYREHSLTRLFKSYFEGYGTVRMVLCVNPSTNLNENLHVLEFGRYTQDVAIDYATPLKQVESKANMIMYEYLESQPMRYELNVNLSDEDFIANWIATLKKNREMKKKYIQTAMGAQAEVRQKILQTINDNTSMKQLYETREKDLRYKEEQMDMVKSNYDEKLKTMSQKFRRLEIDKNEKESLAKELSRSEKLLQKSRILNKKYEKVIQDVVGVMESEEDRNAHLKRLQEVLQRSIHPSAPEMEPLQCSSPMEVPNPSTSETTESNSPPATSTSSEQIEYHPVPTRRSPVKTHFSPVKCHYSPTNNGVPVVNIRRTRSQSCSCARSIHHVPRGTVDTKTIYKLHHKKGRSVKNLRSSDIIGKAGSYYSLVNQKSNPDGELETDVVKGRILDTVCGGANVIFTDIETMKQSSPPSPKRIRASSDAAYTR